MTTTAPPQLGHIYNGDCLEVMRTFADKSVDMVFTSPPYNLVKENSGGGPSSGMKRLEKKYETWYEDEMPEEEYHAWQQAVLRECLRVCRGSVFYNHKIRYAITRRGKVYHPWEIVKDFPVWCEITWDRCNAQGGNSGRYLLADEKIYQIGAPAFWDGAQGFMNIWRFPPVSVPGHPCAFPVELPIRAIVTTTQTGMIVLDPFAGSGTTLVAAERTGRRWVGIEKVGAYVDLAKSRTGAEMAQGKLF